MYIFEIFKHSQNTDRKISFKKIHFNVPNIKDNQLPQSI